jgi:hypothetical protein
MIKCSFDYKDLCYKCFTEKRGTNSERYDGATQEVLELDHRSFKYKTCRYYKTMHDWHKEGKMSFEHDGTIPPLLISYNNNGYVFISDII